MLSSQAISNYYHSLCCGISCHYLLLTSLSSVSTGRTQFCTTVECAGSSKMTDSSYPRMATFPCCLNPCRMFLAWFILKVLIITLSTNEWWKGPLWSHNTEAAVLGDAGIVFSPRVFSAASRESEWQGWTEYLPELTWPCLRGKKNSDLTSTSGISFGSYSVTGFIPAWATAIIPLKWTKYLLGIIGRVLIASVDPLHKVVFTVTFSILCRRKLRLREVV